MTYSLIIPIYNEERTLLSLLKKIEKLDRKIQIIIVNDGSTDSTASILKKYPNIKIITNQSNRGKGASIKDNKYSGKEVQLTSRSQILINQDELDVKITGLRCLGCMALWHPNSLTRVH